MMLEIPVAFFIYNRPDLTLQVFEKIRENKPKKMVVVADGPKHSGEKELTEETRKIINTIDWPCELIKYYSDINLGCAQRIRSGLDFVFEQNEQAIILEDDCLPSSSFFNFCEVLLDTYKHDQSVMHISGCNIMEACDIASSYFFCNYAFPPWGWATWKRAWQKYKAVIANWDEKLKEFEIKRLFFKNENPLWNRAIMANIQKGDTWDHQWAIALWENCGISVIPKYNLVSNIGFDNRAIHTRGNSPFANMPALDSTSDFIHPDNIDIEEKLNVQYLKTIENFFVSLDLWK